MAKLMLIGEVAHVELTSDPEIGQTIATCTGHLFTVAGTPRCTWRVAYATLNDAVEYAADHADGSD
jgi:hypothetical protein